MCFISNAMVNLKNPLTGSTTLDYITQIGRMWQFGRGWRSEGGGTESGITSLICDEQQK